MSDIKIQLDSEFLGFQPEGRISGRVCFDPAEASRGAQLILTLGHASSATGALDCEGGAILHEGSWEGGGEYSYRFELEAPTRRAATMAEGWWLQARVETVEGFKSTARVPVELPQSLASDGEGLSQLERGFHRLTGLRLTAEYIVLLALSAALLMYLTTR